MQEELLIKKFRTGTTIHFFNTNIGSGYKVPTTPCIIKTNSVYSNPIEINSFDGIVFTGENNVVLWKRNDQNNFFAEYCTEGIDYISGYTFSQTFNYKIDNSNLNNISEKFKNNMNKLFSSNTTSFVFFENTLIDDLHVNIKLEKTYDFLNTLQVYNKVTGENIKRESPVGVVFGKLEAIQKISDTSGNKIRIPLRNVPIGIFEHSEEFQKHTDLDKNGNRIRLNYIPVDSDSDNYPIDYKNNYFNIESSLFDTAFLNKAPIEGINVHTTFKNVVYTNENGEFILHNINVGPQIMFFEVDLLKQGLTKDEVALNFFPYPPNFENVSIDTIPHYFYRAIPIDVVPCWGISYQTGYTEVNVSVNLDLRKWSTYIIPPITYKGYSTDSVEYYDKFSRAPITVQVRDMSKFNNKKLLETDPKEKIEVYPSKGIQMVQISNILDKNANQQWEWSDEYSQIKDKALFFNYGFHGIKLPANIYDDESYKTDKYGEIQNNEFSKGVWLCGYQIKIFLTKEDELYRTTGLALTKNSNLNNNKLWFDRDHFHCSLYENIENLNLSQSLNSYNAISEGIGKFPYEMAWSKNYPEKYNIPKPPKVKRYNNFYTEHEWIESPEFEDGEYIYGNSWLNNGVGWNGFGLSWYSLVEQYTDFATDIVGSSEESKMYKYETIGTEPYGSNKYFGCYSNGFFDGLSNVNSNVINGERYQRTEAGYGYFLHSSSLPRIVPTPNGLFGFIPSEVDISPNVQYVNNQNLGFLTPQQLTMSGWWNLNAKCEHYNAYSVSRRGKSISMDLSKKTNNSIVNDKLNIYRIIDGKNRLPYGTQQPIIPTYCLFVIEKMFFTKSQLGEIMFPWIYHKTSSPIFSDNSYVWLDIENCGEEKLHIQLWSDSQNSQEDFYIKTGEKIRCFAGKTVGDYETTFENLSIKTWGNSQYDENTNRFLKTKIRFTTSANWEGYSHGQSVVDLHIRKECSDSICEFSAEDSITSSNTWFADTVWKAIDIQYFKRDGNNGYPNDSSTQHWDGEYANIHGMYYNPGKWSEMHEYADGLTESIDPSGSYDDNGNNISDYLTNRLNNGGSMAFYWVSLSYKQRVNPNGAWNYTPLMSIGSPSNFNDYWNTYACCMRQAGQTTC